MNDFDRLYSYLSDMWLANTPRDSDSPEVKAERNAICAGIDMAIEAVREFAVKNQPRLLTLEEIQHPMVVWLEDRDKPDALLAIGGSTCGYSKCFVTVDGVTIAPSTSEYNIWWRAWSAEPTDEQRKAVKWDG